MTHYEVLGVHSEATFGEIKSSYRALVKIYHPDINPSPEAADKIVLLTEAYDVLSDPGKRSSYDWQLSLGLEAKFVSKQPEPEVDERELYRREYVRWKRKKEQERWEQLFHAKVKFYKYQRYLAFFFIAVALFYSVDFFVDHVEGPMVLKMKLMRYGTTKGKVGTFSFETDAGLYRSTSIYSDTGPVNSEKGFLHFSGIFKLPAGVSLDGEHIHRFFGTLYSMGNFVSYLILIVSIVLLVKRDYHDWSMTIGLLPIFFILFLVVYTVIMFGQYSRVV